MGMVSTYTFFQRRTPMPEVGAACWRNQWASLELRIAQRNFMPSPVNMYVVASPNIPVSS